MHFVLLAGGLMLTPVPLPLFCFVFYICCVFFSFLASPGQKHVIVERLKENASDEEEGDPESPTTYFDRQLRSIRRGEEVDVLKVPLRHSGFGG